MIKQLNFTYEFSDALKVIVGSFSTHLGYELVDAVITVCRIHALLMVHFFNTGVKQILLVNSALWLGNQPNRF
jgi:hypothetical protein